MKKFTPLFILFSFLAAALSAQQKIDLNKTVSTEKIAIDGKLHREKPAKLEKRSSATCANDTIFYVDYKSSAIQFLTLVGKGEGKSGEGLAQWYDAPQPITIHGFIFFGRTKYDASVPVNVRVYSAKADSTPNALLGTTSTVLDFTNPNMGALQRNVNFATPITVTGPYLMVVESPATNTDTIQLVINGDGDGRGEKLSKVRVSGTSWLDLNFAYGGLDADFYGFPIVNYTLSSRFTVSGNMTANETINFTNTSSPVLFSRFYNYAAFKDSTRESFVWNFGDGSAEGNAVDTFHKYINGGSYNVKLTSTIYGYSRDCVADTTGVTVLPITLSRFTGVRSAAANLLSWVTETEQNNKGFEIQRSTDGSTFSAIGFVSSKASNGFSTSAISYDFADEKQQDGNVYYRLKQIDIDGRATLSAVVLLKGVNGNKFAISNIFPNPAERDLHVALDAPAAEKITLVITDLAGKVVMQHAVAVIAGNNNLPVNVSKLSSGTYTIKVICTNGCETSVQKFIKQ